VVWPDGTEWVEDEQAVRLPNGDLAHEGDEVSGGGGSFGGAEDADTFEDSETARAIGDCRRRGDEVAVFNSHEDLELNALVGHESDGPAGEWALSAQLPLSPRTSPQVGWTGAEVLVIGGDVGVPTNPSAEGGASTDEFVADGAAYDTGRDTWRRIADAPEPIPYYYRSTMVGDTMVIQTMHDDGGESGWLAYDAGDDTWTRLPDPPQPNEDTGSISASDGKVVAIAEDGTVQVLDVAGATWSALPASPGIPRLRDGACVVAGAGADVYVSGGSVEGVQRWDGATWTSYDVDECFRQWTGRRLVNEGFWLDPASGRWARLPGAPDFENDPLPDHLSVVAADGARFAAYGYVYDDEGRTWTPIGRPDSPVEGHVGATFVGGRLFVVGGLDDDAGYEDTSGLSDETWVWSP